MIDIKRIDALYGAYNVSKAESNRLLKQANEDLEKHIRQYDYNQKQFDTLLLDLPSMNGHIKSRFIGWYEVYCYSPQVSKPMIDLFRGKRDLAEKIEYFRDNPNSTYEDVKEYLDLSGEIKIRRELKETQEEVKRLKIIEAKYLAIMEMTSCK